MTITRRGFAFAVGVALAVYGWGIGALGAVLVLLGVRQVVLEGIDASPLTIVMVLPLGGLLALLSWSLLRVARHARHSDGALELAIAASLLAVAMLLTGFGIHHSYQQ